jgi:hypothetical protein
MFSIVWPIWNARNTFIFEEKKANLGRYSMAFVLLCYRLDQESKLFFLVYWC